MKQSLYKYYRKMHKSSRGALWVFIIFSIFVFIVSYNITEDWIDALIKGLTAGLSFSFVYVVGYENGLSEGIRKGYDRALEDLAPQIPKE